MIPEPAEHIRLKGTIEHRKVVFEDGLEKASLRFHSEMGQTMIIVDGDLVEGLYDVPSGSEVELEGTLSSYFFTPNPNSSPTVLSPPQNLSKATATIRGGSSAKPALEFQCGLTVRTRDSSIVASELTVSPTDHWRPSYNLGQDIGGCQLDAIEILRDFYNRGRAMLRVKTQGFTRMNKKDSTIKPVGQPRPVSCEDVFHDKLPVNLCTPGLSDVRTKVRWVKATCYSNSGSLDSPAELKYLETIQPRDHDKKVDDCWDAVDAKINSYGRSKLRNEVCSLPGAAGNYPYMSRWYNTTIWQQWGRSLLGGKCPGTKVPPPPPREQQICYEYSFPNGQTRARTCGVNVDYFYDQLKPLYANLMAKYCTDNPGAHHTQYYMKGEWVYKDTGESVYVLIDDTNDTKPCPNPKADENDNFALPLPKACDVTQGTICPTTVNWKATYFNGRSCNKPYIQRKLNGIQSHISSGPRNKQNTHTAWISLKPTTIILYCNAGQEIKRITVKANDKRTPKEDPTPDPGEEETPTPDPGEESTPTPNPGSSGPNYKGAVEANIYGKIVGWACDANNPNIDLKVRIKLNGITFGTVTANKLRASVPGCGNRKGWEFQLPNSHMVKDFRVTAKILKPGTNVLAKALAGLELGFARNLDSRKPKGEQYIPFGNLQPGSGRLIKGWACDRDFKNDIKVQISVWEKSGFSMRKVIDSVKVPANEPDNPDFEEAAAFTCSGAEHWYNYNAANLPPGNYKIDVKAIDPKTGVRTHLKNSPMERTIN